MAEKDLAAGGTAMAWTGSLSRRLVPRAVARSKMDVFVANLRPRPSCRSSSVRSRAVTHVRGGGSGGRGAYLLGTDVDAVPSSSRGIRLPVEVTRERKDAVARVERVAERRVDL